MKEVIAPTPAQPTTPRTLRALQELLAIQRPDLTTELTSESLQIILPGERRVGMVIMEGAAEIAGMLSQEQANLVPELMDLSERGVLLTRVHLAWPLMLALSERDTHISYVNTGPWMHLTFNGHVPPVRIGGRAMPRTPLNASDLRALEHEGAQLCAAQPCDTELGPLAEIRSHLRAFYALMKRSEPNSPAPATALAHWMYERAWRAFERLTISPQQAATWTEQLQSVTNVGPEGVLLRWIKDSQDAEAPRKVKVGGLPVPAQVTGELDDLDFGDEPQHRHAPQSVSRERKPPPTVVRSMSDLKL